MELIAHVLINLYRIYYMTHIHFTWSFIHLKPPEWIARVRSSIEEAAGLSTGAQQVLRW